MSSHESSIVPQPDSDLPSNSLDLGTGGWIRRFLSLMRLPRRRTNREWRLEGKIEGFMGSHPEDPQNDKAEVGDEPNWEIVVKILVSYLAHYAETDKHERIRENLKSYSLMALSKAGKDGIEPAQMRRLLKTGNVFLSLGKLFGTDYKTVFNADLLDPDDIAED